MNVNYFIPSGAATNSAVQRVRADIATASKCLKQEIGLNSFHVNAQSEYDWVVYLTRPPLLSIYQGAENLVVRFRFTDRYPNEGPQVRVVEGIPHPMLHGKKLSLLYAEYWVPDSRSGLTDLLRAIWWSTIAPIVAATVPRDPLATQLANIYEDQENPSPDAYIDAVRHAIDPAGKAPAVSAGVREALRFIRQVQLQMEAERRRNVLEVDAGRSGLAEDERADVTFSLPDGTLVTLPPLRKRDTVKDIKALVIVALQVKESHTEVSFQSGGRVLSSHHSLTAMGLKNGVEVIVVLKDKCDCCVADVDLFQHNRLLYDMKDLCSRRWSVAFHGAHHSQLPDDFIRTVETLLAIYRFRPLASISILPLELVHLIIQKVWEEFLPSALVDFFRSDFCL